MNREIKRPHTDETIDTLRRKPHEDLQVAREIQNNELRRAGGVNTENRPSDDEAIDALKAREHSDPETAKQLQDLKESAEREARASSYENTDRFAA